MQPIEKEKIIALALFKCTVEHSTHLINQFRHKTKQDFNIWIKQGFKILETIEKENPEYYKLVEQLSDVIHTGISEGKEEAETVKAA
jgi:hypothetical protein